MIADDVLAAAAKIIDGPFAAGTSIREPLPLEKWPAYKASTVNLAVAGTLLIGWAAMAGAAFGIVELIST